MNPIDIILDEIVDERKLLTELAFHLRRYRNRKSPRYITELIAAFRQSTKRYEKISGLAAADIIEAWVKGASYKELADRYRVSKDTIGDIVRGRRKP